MKIASWNVNSLNVRLPHLQQWLQDFQPDVVRRMVAGHVAGENHSERLWALLTLEIWQRIFLDGEDPASISMRPAAATVSLSRSVAA